jgi:Uma2 family endonuclease
MPRVTREEIRIPMDVKDLESFRRWARSDTFPETVRYSYLRGDIWVDPDREQAFTHNQVKTEIASVLDTITAAHDLGYFFSDRMLLSHKGAEISTEPDGMVVSFEAVQDGRMELVEGVDGGVVELLGTPDMVLEVVSARSVHKDTVVLRELYHAAEVHEYWLVDALDKEPTFELLRWTTRGYSATRPRQGWLRSAVFGRSFRLTQGQDRLGNPRYTLLVKE